MKPGKSALESALNQWNMKMWSSYTWSLQTNGEKSEGYIMSSVRDNSELKSKDKGFGNVEQRNFTEGRGKI